MHLAFTITHYIDMCVWNVKCLYAVLLVVVYMIRTRNKKKTTLIHLLNGISMCIYMSERKMCEMWLNFTYHHSSSKRTLWGWFFKFTSLLFARFFLLNLFGRFGLEIRLIFILLFLLDVCFVPRFIFRRR